MTSEQIARICHAANRQLQQEIIEALPKGMPIKIAPSGAWEEEPQPIRQAMTAAVERIQQRFIRSPRQSHEEWVEARVKEGWVWGEVKNPVTKQHPNLVPYEDLPPEERRKDELFFNIVKALS